MSRRQEIVDALDARLKTITVVAGYSSDLGKSVFPWRTRPLAENESAFLTYMDTSAPKQAAETGRHHHSLQVEIAVVARATTAPELVRAMIADVVKAIGTDPRFGGLARWTTLTSDALEVDRETRTMAGASLSIEIQYVTNLWEV